MVFGFYVFALMSLAMGTAAVYMTLIQAFPLQWLYVHYFVRKPFTWAIFLGGLGVAFYMTWRSGEFPIWTLVPLALMGLAVILAHRMHQENAFKAVDFPAMADDIAGLPLDDDTQMGVVEFNGVTKAYPLEYVQHHHIINDRVGDRIVSLTFCAMCHSIIPFDVSEIGPLFVGSFKNANMVVADRKTKTFFQQATFESIIGKLHPRTLTMLPFQVLSWGDVKKLDPRPEVVEVTKKDLKDFQLPIPGIWKKVLASEFTPGLSAKKRDTSFPARTRVVGIIDAIAQPQVVYLKEEIVEQGVVVNEDLDVVLVAAKDNVLGFRRTVEGRPLNIILGADGTLSDRSSGTCWDLRGKYVSGDLESVLVPVAISDEYWFSWKLFHPGSELIRVTKPSFDFSGI